MTRNKTNDANDSTILREIVRRLEHAAPGMNDFQRVAAKRSIESAYRDGGSAEAASEAISIGERAGVVVQ